MTDAYYWLEPGGEFNFLGTSIGLWSLNGFTDGVEMTVGVAGIQAPTIRRAHELVAGVAGSRLRSIAHDMRTVVVPFFFLATSEEQLRDLRRLWRRRLNPTRGDGQIIVITDDARWLTLSCRYVGGLDQAEDDTHRGPGWFQADLTFEAADPYWDDFFDTIASWSLGGDIPFWFDPGTSKGLLPIQLAASSVIGRQTLLNDGDVDAWPRWIISGPGTGLTVQSNTLGRQFAWSSVLGTSDQLVIDTKPGVKTVELNGVSAFGALTKYDLWPLVTDDNDVIVTMSGTTADSRVDVAYKRRWLGP